MYREINLKLTILSLLPVALMSLVACGEGSQIADTPTPETKVVAQPSPTQESPKPEPTKTPTPTPAPTATPAPTPEPTAGDLVWRYETGDGVYSSPAVAGGVVYVGSGDRYLYALDAATGDLVWRYQTGDGV